MDKKEILAQNKLKNRNELDEREKRIYNSSFGLGAVAVGVLCLIFSVYKAFHHEMFYEYVSIVTAYLCTAFLYQYKNIKKPVYLIFGIVAGIFALTGVVLFFMVTK